MTSSKLPKMQSLQVIWLGVHNVPVPLGSPQLVPYSVMSYWIAMHHAMQGPLPQKGFASGSKTGH